MNFLGKDIDEASLRKMRDFMNTPKGNELKKQIEHLTKDDIKSLLENAKNKNFDPTKLEELLKQNPDEILKHIDVNKLK